MPETTCINTLLLCGLVAMAAIGFIQAVATVWKATRRQPSPFE